MFYLCFITIVVSIYVVCDFNYIIRTLFVIWGGRICEKHCFWNDATTIYGICTFQDCDVFFRSIRLARLVRELDFARYHFYDRTGIYSRSQQHGIKSLQGATLTILLDPIPLFAFYKIRTKLVYWDQRSLFLEHEIITLHDSKLRYVLVSRQFAIRKDKESTTALLIDDLPGSNTRPKCPEYINTWLDSMKVSSEKLRN